MANDLEAIRRGFAQAAPTETLRDDQERIDAVREAIVNLGEVCGRAAEGISAAFSAFGEAMRPTFDALAELGDDLDAAWRRRHAAAGYPCGQSERGYHRWRTAQVRSCTPAVVETLQEAVEAVNAQRRTED